MPARELPPHADLEFYKGEAKDLLAACKAGDARALDRLQPRHRVQPVLADARFAIAREHDFESWPTFAAHLKRLPHGIDRRRSSVMPSAPSRRETSAHSNACFAITSQYSGRRTRRRVCHRVRRRTTHQVSEESATAWDRKTWFLRTSRKQIYADRAGPRGFDTSPPPRFALRWTTFAWLANRSSRTFGQRELSFLREG